MTTCAEWLAKSYLRIVGLLWFIALTACGSHNASVTTQTNNNSGISIPQAVTNLPNNGTLFAYLRIDGGDRIPMTINSDNTASITQTGLTSGRHTFTIEFEYIFVDQKSKPLLLASASKPLDVGSGVNKLDFADTPYTTDGPNYDYDHDGISNLTELANNTNPFAGVLVTPNNIDAKGNVDTGEDGSSGSFTVVLTSAPTADVKIDLSSSDTTEGIIDTSQITLPLVFTSQNWNQPQSVTVTGVDDNIADGNVDYTIITKAAQSADSNYSGVDPDDVAMTNIDNDTPGITVKNPNPAGQTLHTSESGGSAQFTVVLNSQPTADVIINMISTKTTEGVITSATPITFSASATSPTGPGYWATPQTVTVTGVDDTIKDGPQTYYIQFAVSSADLGYDQKNPADLKLINDDNEGNPAITLTFDKTAIHETGTTTSATLTATAAYVSTTQDMQVQVGFSTGSATLNSDFSTSDPVDPTTKTITLTIPANSTSVTTTVTALKDMVYGEKESVVANIVSATNAVASSAPPASIAITDDTEVPTVNLAIDNSSITEDQSNTPSATLTASLVDSSGTPLTSVIPITVNLTYTPSATAGAIAGTDYSKSDTISIPVNSSTYTPSTPTITTIDDAIAEGTESFNVAIGSVAIGTTGIAGTIGTPNNFDITIIDNDYVVSAAVDANGNGTFNGATSASVTVDNNTPAVFSVTPATGYVLSGAALGGTCGTAQATVDPGLNTVTVNPITTSGCTVTVSFAIQTFTVTASVDANGKGTITAPSSVVVDYGNPANFTVTPASGYSLIGVDASACTGATATFDATANTISVTPITTSCNVFASFAFAHTMGMKGTIAAGLNHTCTLVDGGVQCWGDNTYGQLGNNSTTSSLVPVAVSGLSTGVQAITAGDYHTCALVNGGVQCWGRDSEGELGNNSTAASFLVPQQVSGLTSVSGVQAIVAGSMYTCALVNGGVQCWGDNSLGQLGHNDKLTSPVPEPVSGLATGVQAIAAGANHTCALVNGIVQCWGDNAFGQVGVNSTAASFLVPQPLSSPTSGVQAIAAGGHHTCALVNGGVQCWGDNAFGQVGVNSTAASFPAPQPLSLLASGVQAITAGNGFTCALVDGGVQCWGSNADGQVGDNSFTNRLAPVQSGLTSGVQALSAGSNHICALVNGGMQCWGSNASGQLGNKDANLSNKPVPVQVPGIIYGMQAIAVGAWHTCALVNGGMQCWGDDTAGQSTDVIVTSDVQAIAAGNGFTCALVNGGVQCWGDNSNGALGNGSTTATSSLPVQVSGLTSGVQAIIAGYLHVCALVNGGVQCWGDNTYGQLGNNDSTVTNSNIPVQVSGLTSGVQAIAKGGTHTCALVNGSALCWGANNYGQLGNNDPTLTNSYVPVSVSSFTSGVQAIAGGDYHTCALVNGGMQCWGDNVNGELGNNSTTNSLLPVQVNGLTSGVQAMTAGAGHTCALVNGGMQCWGNRGHGQLGTDFSTSNLVPEPVQGLSVGVQVIDAGVYDTCAIVNGGMQCWGDNIYGQLGNSSAPISASAGGPYPVTVTWPW